MRWWRSVIVGRVFFFEMNEMEKRSTRLLFSLDFVECTALFSTSIREIKEFID